MTTAITPTVAVAHMSSGADRTALIVDVTALISEIGTIATNQSTPDDIRDQLQEQVIDVAEQIASNYTDI